MAVTLLQILELAGARAAEPWPTPAEATADAAGAFGYLGRAIDRLTDDGVGEYPGAPRHAPLTTLARACTHVADLHRTADGGQLTDLTGAAADFTGRLRDRLARDERWALGIAYTDLAVECRTVLAEHLPPTSDRTSRLTLGHLNTIGGAAGLIAVERITRPPHPLADAVLDTTVPPVGTSRGLTGPQAAGELAVSLTHATDHADRSVGLTAWEVRLLCGAGEAIADRVAALPHRPEDTPAFAAPCAAAWRATRLTLATIDDGQDQLTRPDIRGRVVAIIEALARDTPALHHREDLQLACDQLPSLARTVANQVRRWAQTGAYLQADARVLPAVDHDLPLLQMHQILAREPVTLLPDHLRPAQAAAERAGRLSIALAAENSQRPEGRTPAAQPRLDAVYRGLVQPRGTSRYLAQEAQQAVAAARQRPRPGHGVPR